MTPAKTLVLRALRTEQARDIPLYAFFARGKDIVRIADISRIARSGEALLGFQRDAVLRHIRAITEYLDQGPSLFPNAIILALSPRVKFTTSRGTKPVGVYTASDIGTLHIPVHPEGSRAAWIVDGQQRSLALARATKSDIPVPVVAFASDDLNVHRQQFVLVNKVRPLRPSLVDELLPEVQGYIPKDLSPRNLPSALVNALNLREDSPLMGRIARPSQRVGNVSDRAMLNMIRQRINSPLGALAQYKPSGDRAADCDAMVRKLIAFWSAVKDAFPNAWKLEPERSRLLHGAGVEALGALMDRYAIRFGDDNFLEQSRAALRAIAPRCAWTAGAWPDLTPWNSIENTSRGIRALTEQLMQLDLFTHVHRAA